MSRKSNLMSLLAMILAAMLSVSITSCSSSDDDNDSSFKSSDLIGTWRNAIKKSGIRTFNADGTIEGSDTYSNWKYSDGKLYMTRHNNGRIETWLVEYKDNLLYLTLPDGAATEREVLEKINLKNTLHLTREYFVGKWNEGSSTVWEFLADGRCTYVRSDQNETRNGNWEFDQETQTLKATTTYYTPKTGMTNHEWKIIYATTDDFTGLSCGMIRIK